MALLLPLRDMPMSPMRLAPWTTLAVAAFVAVGRPTAVFGGIAASDWSSAKAACKGQPVSCTTTPSSPGFESETSATTRATVSTASFVAGGVLAAGGVVVFVTAPKSTAGDGLVSARGVELVPTGGPGGMGMMVMGSF